MRTGLLRKIIAVCLVLSFSFSFAEEKPKNSGGKEKILQLSAPSVIRYLLNNNYDVQKALLDYRKTGSGLLRYKGMYDYSLYANGRYSGAEDNTGYNPNLAAKSYSNLSGSAGISRKFSTGTTIIAGITSSTPSYEKLTTTGRDLDLYQTGLNIELTQDVLKNSFGQNDRYGQQKMYNRQISEREAIRTRLAGLIVDALVAYWNIAVAEENLKTREISLNSTLDIKKLVLRKISLGLSEKEDVSDWSGKALDEMSRRDVAEKSLFDARLGMKRVLNLDSDVKLLLGKTFRSDEPGITFEQALKDAFLKRSDLKNKMVDLQNAGLDLKIAMNNGLPVLKIKASYGNNTYDSDNLPGTISQYNPEYSIGFEFNYPINGRASKADIRDARTGVQTRVIEIRQMESEIRDEVLSRVKQCEVDYRVYLQTKQSSEFARSYYVQVLQKFKRGRYSAVELKMALDAYIVSRQAVLKSLVDYNISILKRDLSRNVIFENYSIDIDSVLKQVEN